MRPTSILFSTLLLLPACLGDLTAKDPGGGGGGRGGRDPVVLDCGYNAHQVDDACVCMPHYDWCDARGEGEPCCAWDARSFTVTVVDAKVLPYQDMAAEEPWDWDGDVPDWLIEAMEIIGTYDPRALTWAEVLSLVDEYAPELMEGYVPPDPVIDAYIDEDYLASSATDDDTYEPYWAWSQSFNIHGAQEGWLEFYDEDLVVDDEVLYLGFTHDDLASVAGPDDFVMQDIGFLYELTLRIDPVW